MTREQLMVKYKLNVDTLTYNGIIDAIPKHWRACMTKYSAENEPKDKSDDEVYIADRRVKISTLSNQMLYWHLLDRIIKPPTALSKWMEEFPFLNDQDFSNYFTLPYSITRDTKLQTFQYAILNNILPCQALLFRWGIAENKSCLYCNMYDSLSHHLYECNEVNLFWKQLIKWVKNNLNAQIPLSRVDVLFGIPQLNDSLIHCMNLLILLGKWFIHKCALNNKKLFLLEFLPQVKNHLATEEHIAHLNGKEEQFNEQWGLLNETL